MLEPLWPLLDIVILKASHGRGGDPFPPIAMFLLVGLAAGWLGGQITTGRGFGLLGNLIVGVLGALLGGFLFGLLGLSAGGLAGSLLTAVVGAVALLYLLGSINR